jgi:hypothetical protein
LADRQLAAQGRGQAVLFYSAAAMGADSVAVVEIGEKKAHGTR